MNLHQKVMSNLWKLINTTTKYLIWGMGVLYVFSQFIPKCNFDGLSNGDSNWVQAIHVAYNQRFQFGKDIVFTYGPWGFLAQGYYPPTYLTSVIAWQILAFIFLCSGWKLASYFTKNTCLAWAWIALFTIVTTETDIPGISWLSKRRHLAET